MVPPRRKTTAIQSLDRLDMLSRAKRRSDLNQVSASKVNNNINVTRKRDEPAGDVADIAQPEETPERYNKVTLRAKSQTSKLPKIGYSRIL